MGNLPSSQDGVPNRQLGVACLPVHPCSDADLCRSTPNGLGWRMHCGAEVTESSTNKQHLPSHPIRCPSQHRGRPGSRSPGASVYCCLLQAYIMIVFVSVRTIKRHHHHHAPIALIRTKENLVFEV
jgi:hypothetical protein